MGRADGAAAQMADTMNNNLQGQLTILNKLGCIISTKYPKINNPFEDEVDYAKKVLDGLVEDEKVFATQGDYGLIQCLKGCHQKTYDAVDMFKQMIQATKDCKIPSYMVPKCPVCGGEMAMNLRSDSHFVEDEHWHEQDKKFGEFLTKYIDKKLVLFELGVGFNTPTIIRFPFENLVREHKNISLVRLNMNEAVVPESLGERAIGINADISHTLIEWRK